jgi:hypothetical protein
MRSKRKHFLKAFSKESSLIMKTIVPLGHKSTTSFKRRQKGTSQARTLAMEDEPAAMMIILANSRKTSIMAMENSSSGASRHTKEAGKMEWSMVNMGFFSKMDKKYIVELGIMMVSMALESCIKKE